MCLVTDFVEGGALDKKLTDPRVVFDWPLILKLAKVSQFVLQRVFC
jgi:hypothetical protein